MDQKNRPDVEIGTAAPPARPVWQTPTLSRLGAGATAAGAGVTTDGNTNSEWISR